MENKKVVEAPELIFWAFTTKLGSMIFGKDKMISYLYRFLLLAVPLI